MKPIIQKGLIVIASCVFYFYPIAAKCQTPIDLSKITLQSTDEYIFIGRPALFYYNLDYTYSHPGDTTGTVPLFNQSSQFVFTIVDTFHSFNSSNVKFFYIKFAKFKIKGSPYKLRKEIKLALKYNVMADSVRPDLNNKQTLSDSVKYLKEILSDDEKTQYFVVSESDLKRYAFIYAPVTHWEFAYGTVSELVRYRMRVDSIRGVWNSDVNFGVSVGAKYSFGKDWGITSLFGFGVTKVSLDSISTRGYLGASKEHASLTPSFNFLLTYKNFSIGAGIGWDIVNRDSKEVNEWAFNHKLFFGLAFGINIFSSSNANATTDKPSSPQATKN